MKIILGTAEFGHAAYGPPPEIEEIRRILALAKEGGISILDTAETYGCVEILKKEAKGFSIYTKTRDWKVNLDWGQNELRGILYHYQPYEAPVELPSVHRWVNLGVSVYDLPQLPAEQHVLQIPFNINNRDFIRCFDTHRTVYVRRVFDNGKLLKKYSVKECLEFVNKYRPDGVIVGVKKHKELEEILKAC